MAEEIKSVNLKMGYRNYAILRAYIMKGLKKEQKLRELWNSMKMSNIYEMGASKHKKKENGCRNIRGYQKIWN